MLTLSYPYDATIPDVIVELPNPTLGDSIQQSLKTKYGFAMSGKIRTTIVRQPEKKFQFNFDHLKRSEMDSLISLLEVHGSEFFKMVDWLYQPWKVKCLSTPIEFTEDLNFYACQLEFQGTPL